MSFLLNLSTILQTWVTAHASLTSGLVVVLGSIIVVDHYLASTAQFGSNSTGQAVVKWVGVICDDILKVLSPAAEAALPPAPAATAPVAAAPAPAKQA